MIFIDSYDTFSDALYIQLYYWKDNYEKETLN